MEGEKVRRGVLVVTSPAVETLKERIGGEAEK